MWGRAEPIPRGYSTALLKLTHHPPGPTLEYGSWALKVSAASPTEAGFGLSVLTTRR